MKAIYISALFLRRKVKYKRVEKISNTNVVGKAMTKYYSFNPGLVLDHTSEWQYAQKRYHMKMIKYEYLKSIKRQNIISKKQPNQKMGRRPKQTFLQRRQTDGPTGTRKDAEHH